MCHTTWRRAYILDTFFKSGFEPEMLDLQSNALPFGYSPVRPKSKIAVCVYSGPGWTRTNEAVRQGIYSPPQLPLCDSPMVSGRTNKDNSESS